MAAPPDDEEAATFSFETDFDAVPEFEGLLLDAVDCDVLEDRLEEGFDCGVGSGRFRSLLEATARGLELLDEELDGRLVTAGLLYREEGDTSA